MSAWLVTVLAFGLLWATQVAGTYLQTRHYRRVLGRITESETEGYVGVGNSRAKLGAGVILILVANGDGRLREALQMRGRSVFARFKPAPSFVGMQVSSLASPEPLGIDRGVAAAARQAAEQILKVRAGTAVA